MRTVHIKKVKAYLEISRVSSSLWSSCSSSIRSPSFLCFDARFLHLTIKIGIGGIGELAVGYNDLIQSNIKEPAIMMCLTYLTSCLCSRCRSLRLCNLECKKVRRDVEE